MALQAQKGMSGVALVAEALSKECSVFVHGGLVKVVRSAQKFASSRWPSIERAVKDVVRGILEDARALPPSYKVSSVKITYQEEALDIGGRPVVRAAFSARVAGGNRVLLPLVGEIEYVLDGDVAEVWLVSVEFEANKFVEYLNKVGLGGTYEDFVGHLL